MLVYNIIMRRVLLTIEYDGSGFSGWQKQTGMRTVQGEIETAIEKITGSATEVFGSGRTDAGVHALGQTAHFDLSLPVPISKLADVLNNLLPPDIAIKKAEYVPMDFHARFSIKSKRYQYRIYTSQEKKALSSRFEAQVRWPLDVKKMQKASRMFLGEHDFKGYCSSAAVTNDYCRTIYNIDIFESDDYIFIEVEGSGFLYNMVRIIVGTLVDIGQGKLGEEDAKKALEIGDRALAGVTMPAGGLYLKETIY